jgi:hypothetical protein
MRFICPSPLLLCCVTLVDAFTGASVVERQSGNAANCSALELVIGKVYYLVLALLEYLHVMPARGTNEPLDPNFGAVVGDPLFEATQNLISGVTGYAVNVSLVPFSNIVPS